MSRISLLSQFQFTVLIRLVIPRRPLFPSVDQACFIWSTGTREQGAMTSVRSDDPPPRPPPIRPPVCPDCDIPMRLESGLPDTRYVNIRHMIFTCDCGRISDQMIADSD